MDDENHSADVIHIFTGEPYVPDVPIERIDERDEAGLPTIDQDSIRQLEYMLEDMKNGKAVGFVGMTWDREQFTFKNVCSLPPRVSPTQAAFMFSGGLETLKIDLTEMATFGAFGGEDAQKTIIMMNDDPDGAS